MSRYKFKKLVFKTFCHDKADFEMIYERYRPVVTSLLRYQFPSMDAADILESYDSGIMEVYEQMDQNILNDERSLCGIIERAAYFNLVDTYRKERKISEHFVHKDYPYEEILEDEVTPELSDKERLLQEGVYEMVLDLEHPCDKVISMRYFDKIKWKAIASVINVNQQSKSVHYWHNKCLNIMKAVIMERCPELVEIYR